MNDYEREEKQVTIEATLERIALSLEQLVMVASRAIPNPTETAAKIFEATQTRVPQPPEFVPEVPGEYLVTLKDGHPAVQPPPAQIIAAVGTAMSAFSAPAASWPQYAIEARKLADDPTFQSWAISKSGRNPDDVPDAVAFALQYLCRVCGALTPADFAIPLVIEGFIAMKNEFGRVPC